jgi:CDP-paratose 2-epimerase
MVLDSASVKGQWDWQPTVGIEQILEEIARHADAHPEWLKTSGCI